MLEKMRTGKATRRSTASPGETRVDESHQPPRRKDHDQGKEREREENDVGRDAGQLPGVRLVPDRASMYTGINVVVRVASRMAVMICGMVDAAKKASISRPAPNRAARTIMTR